MANINPYLNFNGKAEEVFNFYKSIFGGEFATVMRYGDAPGCDEVEGGNKLSESDNNKIMHIALPIGSKGDVLMGSDVPDSMGQLKQGDNFSISISTDSKEEADRIFNGLAESGKIDMPIGDAFWGSYFGMCADKFGIQWMVSYDPNYAQQ